MINLPELGYTPANLRTLLEKTSTSHEQAAELLDVSPRAVQRWCIDLGRDNHRDMPLARWNGLLNALELIMKPALEAALVDAITVHGGNLVYLHGHPDMEPHLSVNYRGTGRWDIAVQDGPPRKSHGQAEGEYFVAAGVASDAVDYSNCNDYWPEEQAEIQASAAHVSAHVGKWVDEILDAFGLEKVGKCADAESLGHYPASFSPVDK